ncbi:MAG: hypothetical protein HFE64_10940 [Lachnospiraceae bacterium]|jgi:hypothetical protein|nr:hypothetical protein [Lachnospiraceae bacterium]
MNASFTPILERYNYLNQFASPGQILFFGSSYLDQFPLYELKEDYGVSQTLFKRSLPGLHIEDAISCLSTCVYPLAPTKLFLSFGDDERSALDFSCSAFIASYQKLLSELRLHLPHCQIYVLSVYGESEDSPLNQALRELTHAYPCEFISLSAQKAPQNFTNGCPTPPYIDDFRHIKTFLHPQRFSFSEAWNAAF